LVVEDDAAVLALVERLLSAKGYTVLGANDPSDADAVLREHGRPPDVLLADIILSGDTGLDYAKVLKRRHPTVRVGFMTGLAHRAPAALRSGLGPVLNKPFSADDLYRFIHQLARP
jgi:two-component system cell cycle sensor histidine kinase/response regulator CckA